MGTNESEKEETKEVDDAYRCFGTKPRSLQCMNNVRCHVIWQCVFNFFEGFIVNGVINVVLVALEKRYALPSSKSGLIASSNDFGAIGCSVLFGYFGEQRHKPRLMAAGILFMMAGCIVFSLPHFIGDTYHYTVSQDSQQNSTDNFCQTGNGGNTTCQSPGTKDIHDNYVVYYTLLIMGNILLGIGASPMFTIGLSYIDENCESNQTAFYISWTFCAAAIGVAIGYVVGGQTLSLFVDIDKVDITSVPLTPMDPQWVGAWWISPIIALIGFLVVFFPILGYPRRLPNYETLQKKRAMEAHGGGDEITAQANFGKSWKDFPKSVWLLVTNPTYVLICFGAAFEALVIGGMATFGAKLIQERFNVTITWAGTVMGIITIPGSGGGMLLGGYLVKRFNLKCRGIIRMCAGFMLAAFCFGPFMLAHCTNDPIAGINKAYIMENVTTGLISTCNKDCGCTTEGLEPICVHDVVYFSPCHAGCTSSATKDGMKTYKNCSCLHDVTGTEQVITPGLCSDKCAWLWAFCALFLVVMILTFATMSPGVTALFRCVPDKQRSIGIGLNLVFVRLVGTTPGPILLGAIIDSTCEVWQDSCGTSGTCWIYDKHTMGIRIVLWFMCLKLCGFVSFMLASFVYRLPPDDGTEQTAPNDQKVDN